MSSTGRPGRWHAGVARRLWPNSPRGRAVLLTSLAMATAKAVSLLTIVISVPLTLAYLGPERYGIWMAISSVTALLGIADLGMGLGLMTLVARAAGAHDDVGLRQCLVSGMLLLVLVALLAGIAFAAVFPLIAWSRVLNIRDPAMASEAAEAIAVFAVCFLGGIASSSVVRIQMGLQKGFVANLWQAAGSVGGLCAVLVAIRLRLGLPGLVLAQSGIPLLMTLANAAVFLPRLDLPLRLSDVHWTAMRRIFAAGAGFFVLQMDGIIGYASDGIIVAHVLGPVAATELSIPARMFSVVGIVLSTLLAPLWPAYTEAKAAADHGWIRTTLLRSLRMSLLGALLASVLLCIGGRSILALWVGDRVHPDTALLLALGVWTVLECIGVSLSMFLNGFGVVRAQLYIATLFAASALVLKFWLVGRVGIVGIPVATTLAYLLTTLVPYALIVPGMTVWTGQTPTHRTGTSR